MFSIAGKMAKGAVISLLVLFVATAAASAAVQEGPRAPRSSSSQKAAHVPNQLIVKYKDIANQKGARRLVRVPANIPLEEAIILYERNPIIEYAEPNYIAYATGVPNDPYYALQWHFDNAEYGGVHAQEAWDISTGLGTVVAVVDTGVAYENYNEGRGRKYYRAPDLASTCFVAGIDLVNNDTHPNDDNSHGTHVAGTIAQSSNNSLGAAGLAHRTCIMPIKVLNQNGSGTYNDIADGVIFATDNGANVINMSLGGDFDSQTLRDAVQYAYDRGVVVVASAGNNSRASLSYPAAYSGSVLSVGATRYDEQRSWYSNYGAGLSVVAPGGDLGADQNNDGYGDGVLQNTFNPNTKNTSDFGYWFFDGTSMAAPHVSALAALVISNGNAVGADQVRRAIEETADDLGASGWDSIYGNGLINAPAALNWTSGPLDLPPAVTLIFPIEGATATGTSVYFAADASDDYGVARVEFLVDGQSVGTDTAAPYGIMWDSTSVGDGVHTVTATATDTVGQTAQDSATIEVDNVNNPPIADAGEDQQADIGITIVFDGSGSSDDRGIVRYEWDFGDSATSIGQTAYHEYALAGVYTAVLTVTDTDGVIASDSATITITDPNAGPSVISVESVGYALNGGKDSHKHVSVNMHVVDEASVPVSAVQVSFIVSNGASQWSASGITDSIGNVSYTIINAPSGCYSTIITGVSASGFEWDGLTPANQICK